MLYSICRALGRCDLPMNIVVSPAECALYIDVLIKQRIYCLLAYPKNVQTDLTEKQKKMIRNLIAGLREE